MRGEKSGQEIRTHFEIHDKTASDDVLWAPMYIIILVRMESEVICKSKMTAKCSGIKEYKEYKQPELT